MWKDTNAFESVTLVAAFLTLNNPLLILPEEKSEPYLPKCLLPQPPSFFSYPLSTWLDGVSLPLRFSVWLELLLHYGLLP